MSENKIHIDSDWKEQAQAEKEKLVQQSKEKTSEPDANAMPPANIETLISTFVQQAVFAMGMMPDPRTGQPYFNLDMARHSIDMLEVISEKTQGNITQEEEKLLKQTTHELRTQYIQISKAASQAAP